MSTNTLFECASITAIFILSHSLAHRHLNIKHIHNILFSILISYSSYRDIVNITSSMSSRDPSWLNIDIVTAYFYYSYAVYYVYTHWNETQTYMKAFLTLSTIGCVYMHVGGALRLMVVVGLFACYGHVYVILHLLTYMYEAGLLSSLSYKHWNSVIHLYGIVPIVLGLYFMAIYMLYTYVGNPVLFAHLKIMSGIVAFGFHGLYVLWETGATMIDYGYNRALARIRAENDGMV